MTARAIEVPWWVYAIAVGGATGCVAAATTYALTRRWRDALVQGVATLTAAAVTSALSRVLYVKMLEMAGE